jgi:hypothetical protein
VDDMAELLQLHEMIDLDGLWVTDAVNVVAREVDQHDVFRAVFLRRQQLFTKLLVLWKRGFEGVKAMTGLLRTFRCLATLGCTRNRMVEYLVFLNLTERLRASADNLEIATVKIKHIWTWIHLA